MRELGVKSKIPDAGERYSRACPAGSVKTPSVERPVSEVKTH
jgi:hypothetical protein